MIYQAKRTKPHFKYLDVKGKKKKKKKRKRNTIVVRLSLIYSSAIVAITMAIDRACPPPFVFLAYVDGKKKKKSVVS